MMEVILDFKRVRGQVVAVVSEAFHTPDRIYPLDITHFTPMTNVPVLGKDSSGSIPQIIVDELFHEILKGDNLWWHEYYKCRRDDQVKYADQIAEADASFKLERSSS